MAPPITVHGVGPCPLDGYGLPYASLDGVTVYTGDFHSLPVHGVTVFGDVTCHSCGTIKRGIWESIAIKTTGAHNMNRDGGATNFHSATPSCCHVMPHGCTDDDSRSLGIEINLQVKPRISVLKYEYSS